MFSLLLTALGLEAALRIAYHRSMDFSMEMWKYAVQLKRPSLGSKVELRTSAEWPRICDGAIQEWSNRPAAVCGIRPLASIRRDFETLYLIVSGVLRVKDECPRSQPGCWYLSNFIFADMHYNAAGNALVADEVIKSLTEEPPTKRTLGVSGRVASLPF